ncbi:uncharacterized protein [Amphiura filiformis]|uniref:uncharacterized protein n=1 Tax=Amphiura filiformis TaxID=82378 RepID=UPI003B222769
MAATGKPTHSPKKDKDRMSERCCFVCKRSILLFKYINLATIRQSSNSQKKDIIKQLETILDCEETTSREWKFICDPCRNTANDIFQYLDKNTDLSDEVVAMKNEFVRKYRSPGVLTTQSNKKNRGSRLSFSGSTTSLSRSPVSSASAVERRKSNPLHFDSRETKTPDKTSKPVKLKNGKGENTKPGSFQSVKPRKSSGNPQTTKNVTEIKSPDRTPKGGNLQNGKRESTKAGSRQSVKQEHKKKSLGSGKPAGTSTPTQQTKSTTAKTKGGAVSSKTNDSLRKADDRKEKQGSLKKKPSIDSSQQQNVLNDEDSTSEASSLNITAQEETPIPDTKDITTGHTEQNVLYQAPKETPEDLQDSRNKAFSVKEGTPMGDTKDNITSDSEPQNLEQTPAEVLEELQDSNNEALGLNINVKEGTTGNTKDNTTEPQILEQIPAETSEDLRIQPDINIATNTNNQLTDGDHHLQTEPSNSGDDLVIDVVDSCNDDHAIDFPNPITDSEYHLQHNVKAEVQQDQNVVSNVHDQMISDVKLTADEDIDVQASVSNQDGDLIICNEGGSSEYAVEDFTDPSTKKFQEMPNVVASVPDQLTDEDLQTDEDHHLPTDSSNVGKISSEDRSEEDWESAGFTNRTMNTTYRMQPLLKVEFQEMPNEAASVPDQLTDEDLQTDEDHHLPTDSSNFGKISSEGRSEEDWGSAGFTNRTMNTTYRMQPLVKVEDGNCMSLDEIKELRLVMDIKAAAFREESRTQKGKISELQLQAIISQHRKQKEESDRLRNLEKLRMKETLKEKLAKRRSRKSSPMVTSTISEDTKENTMTKKDSDNAPSPVKEAPKLASSLPSNEDYEQIRDNHAREVTELQQKIDLQKKRQSRELLDKLANRRTKRGNREVLRSLSVEEVEEIQSAIDENYNKIKEETKDNTESHNLEEEEQESLNELQLMQQQLDEEKELLIANLLAKLERRTEYKEESNMTEEEMKQLELYLNEKDFTFKQSLESKRGSITEKEYRERLHRHNEQMQMLWDRINGEKARLNQSANDDQPTMEGRPDANDDDDEEEVDNEVAVIERELEMTIASLTQEAEELGPLLSDDEYEQLETQHRRKLQEVNYRLHLAMEREKHRTDKDEVENTSLASVGRDSADEDRAIDLVKRIIAPNYDENDDFQPVTEADYKILEDDINTYNSAIVTHLNSKLQAETISEPEYHQCMKEHQRNMQICDGKLERYRHQLWDFMGLSDSNDDGDSEEAGSVENFEKHVPDPVPATTQLWTTPIQQPILGRVPLREEVPIRSKNQLFKDPSVFKHLDAHAIKLAQLGSLVTQSMQSQTSFSALLNELTRIGTTELEKVRLIFRWITAQNCQYMDIADAIDDTPLGVLKGLYHGKITFATLFTRMCRFQGLQCVEISGCAKLKDYEPGKSTTLEDPSYVHNWNAVRIDGYWYFIDCNWGVSYIPGSVSFDPFRYEYDEHYFLTDPETMITTHFPRNASWQLLPNPITLEQFNTTVPVKPYFCKFGFELLSHSEPVIDTYDGDLDIHICCPDGFILYCKVTTVVGNKEVNSKGIRFSQYVSISQAVKNGAKIDATCNIRFPEPGHYYVTLYAKEQFIDDDLNLESQTEICKYYVKCYAPSNDQEPLPEAPANHWGPIGIGKAGLIPVTHTNAVIECRHGEDIEIKFKKWENVIIRHELTKNGLDGQQLAAYASHREFGDEIIFTLRLPEIGLYGFHIFTLHQGINEEVHLCSYLIVMAPAGQSASSLPPPPDGEKYGSSQAFHDLGITSFTHPDPFIQTSDNDLQIVFGLSAKKATLKHSLMYISPTDGSRRDVSKSAKCQFETGAEGSSVTFYLHFKKPGYYQFCLEGKEKAQPSRVPSTSLYNYLIRMD